MKKRLLPLVLTLVIWAVLYYVQLPAINIKSQEFWGFMAEALAIGLVVNMWTIVKAVLESWQNREERRKNPTVKRVVFVIGLFALFYAGGVLLSSPILRAKAYRELLDIQTGDFSMDIREVNYNQIPILDKDSAARLAERKMGSLVDMVSQYEVSDDYTQINFNTRPVRVTPLEYGNEIKWFLNRKTGIPAYMKIDMTTQDVECIKLEDGIKISPAEHFGRNLLRYIRFRYPTYMFRNLNFEIDDAGVPYWICPVVTHTIGLFGGEDIVGAVCVNAITGEHQYYDIADVPQWIDVVYDAELLTRQYNYYGTLVNGYINSVFGQKGCLQTTEGYNYIALNDDVWVYTGVTSVGADESNVGFILMNQRTKETVFYPISGAKEISAMSSAEGQVQHLGYQATFPLLINIGGEPTYFLALKDSAGLVKKYAMVNIEKYQIVATGDSVMECEKVYHSLMNENGVETEASGVKLSAEGQIAMMKDIVIDGNTYYYIMLDSGDTLYEIKAQDHLPVLKKKVGDWIILSYIETSVPGIGSVLELQ